jgi:hypothetical protein
VPLCYRDTGSRFRVEKINKHDWSKDIFPSMKKPLPSLRHKLLVDASPAPLEVRKTFVGRRLFGQPYAHLFLKKNSEAKINQICCTLKFVEQN